MFEAHGYKIYAHPAFTTALQALLADCLRDQTNHPKIWQQRAAFKRLRQVFELIGNKIPANPTDPSYRLGKTLGGGNTGWFRAKFGNGRFRLFYRVSVSQKLIILGWLNDEDTKRTYGAPNDAYAVFAQRLADDNPPGDWEALRAAATLPQADALMAAISQQCQTLLGYLG